MHPVIKLIVHKIVGYILLLLGICVIVNANTSSIDSAIFSAMVAFGLIISGCALADLI